MKLPKLTVIGGGQMARALVGGMIRKNAIDPADVTVVDPAAAMRDWWATNHPACRTMSGSVEKTAAPSQSQSDAFADCEMVLLAVKPHIVGPVLNDRDANFDGKLVISIAAGVPLEKLAAGARHGRVVRVMPNTPSLVGEGAAAFCTGDAVTAADVAHVETMLGSVGYVTRVSENQLDAVTGLSGSGPAYVFMIIEALADGGVAAGLPRSIAMDLAVQTVRGAATMVRDTGEHPGTLKDNVCSPGGTTIAAVRVLEHNALRGALIDAVAASAARSRELAN